MTALAAALSNGQHDVKTLVDNMLSVMKHRGQDQEITQCSERSSLGIRYRLGQQRLFQATSGTAALNGAFFGKSETEQARIILGLPKSSPQEYAALRGAYSALVASNQTCSAIRDPIGLKPLYYSKNTNLIAIASERKALWKISSSETQRILPGYVYTATPKRFVRRRLLQLHPPAERAMTLNYASKRLGVLLRRSIRLITSDVDRVTVAFSGGLDSALTALLAKQANLDVKLISTGLVGSPELQTVEEYAKALDLPISIQTYTPDSLEEYTRRILWLIEEPDLMKVSVAIPLHWAAMLAAQSGYSVMLCGQGSDELYGGYYKYARILDTEGKRSLRSALHRSVVEASQVNYERDEQATSPSGVELRTPFADLDVIRFSLQIPLQYKVQSGNDVMRKWVLRAAAKQAGLVDDIVWRRKKAIQHGTGVENALRKMAKKENQNTESYLLGLSKSISGMEEMP